MINNLIPNATAVVQLDLKLLTLGDLGRSHDTFTDVTKFVEECGLVDSTLWCHKYFLCHMTCPNQLELGERKKSQKKLTDESTKEGPHSVGVWTLKMFLKVCSRLEFALFCSRNVFIFRSFLLEKKLELNQDLLFLSYFVSFYFCSLPFCVHLNLLFIWSLNSLASLVW